MYQNYKNTLMRVIAWLHLAGALVFLLLIALQPQRPDSWRLAEFVVVGLAILWQLHRNPRSNLASWILCTYLLAINLLLMDSYFHADGKVQTSILFPLPLLWNFLLGRKWGWMYSAILLAGLLVFLPFHGWSMNVYGNNGQIFLFSLIATMVLAYTVETMRERHMQRTAIIAETDSLTGLENRTGFMMRLEAAITRARPFYLVQLDLDDFRRINLTMGSNAADQLLIKVSQRLKAFPDLMDLCRHYGDEFAGIFERPPDRLEHEINEILQEVSELSPKHTGGMPLRMTVGAARYPDDATNARELWANAELALQHAKSEGKSRLRFYQPSDAEVEKQQIGLLESLRIAVKDRTLQVHFQPKVSLDQRRVNGMEALVRWIHPERGYIPPLQFIALAEQHGLIHDLGKHVLDKSVEFLSSLDQRRYGGLTVAVNISPPQLLQPGFRDYLQGLCGTHRIPPHRIFLEITEGVLLQQEVRETLLSLRAVGFHMSLDDFGTGYSSLSYLNRFQFDELKVDKSFTDGLSRSERDRHIFKTMLHLSQGLRMETVVEGVETREQLELVQELGAVQVQGWYFASAMPPEKFQDYLASFDYEKATMT